MNPLSMALTGGALGAGVGVLSGRHDRALTFGLVGAVAGAIVGKLASKTDATQHAVGLQCPEGWDLVATDHQIACAYRKKAACLSGFQTDTGSFHCSDWDFPTCPPGTETHPDGPRNWCFPTAAATHATGAGDGGMSFEEAWAHAEQQATIGHASGPDPIEKIRAELSNGAAPAVSACAPETTSVVIKAAIQNGHAVGVSVYATPPNPAVSACIASRVRRINFTASGYMDAVTASF